MVAAPFSGPPCDSGIGLSDGVENAVQHVERLLERHRIGRTRVAADREATMTNDHVAAGIDHVQCVLRLVDIGRGEHVVGARAPHHLDLPFKAETGGLEVEPVLSVDTAHGRKIDGAGEADAAHILEQLAF
jgi:hypothetical protein